MQDELKPIAIRAARIAFAIVLAGVSLYPALHIWNERFVRPFMWRDQRGTDDERFFDRSGVAPNARISRRLTLHVTASRLRAEQQLDVRGDPNLCRALHQSALRQQSRATEWATGWVNVDNDYVSFEPAEVTATEGPGECTVQASIAEQRIFRNEDAAMAPSDLVAFQLGALRANDLLVVFHAKDVRVGGMTKTPSRLPGGGLAFHWKDDVPESGSFRLTRSTGTQPRIGDVVTGVDQNWLPFLGPPLTMFLVALPYALFVVVGRRFATARSERLIEMAEWFLTLYLLLHLTFVIVSVNDWIFHGKLKHLELQPFVGGETFGAVFASFACIVWPLLVWRWRRTGHHSKFAETDSRVPRAAFVALAASAISAGIVLYATWAPAQWPHLREEVISAFGIVAFAAACWWLMRELGGGALHAMILLFAASGLSFMSGPHAPVATLPLAALFLFGLIVAVRAGFAPERRPAGVEIALYAVVAAIAVKLFMPASFFTPYWEIHALSDASNNAVLLALALAFLVLLHDHSARDGSSTHAAGLGFAFALAIFFNHRSGVYGAVVVGSGYLLLRYLLFPHNRRSPLVPADAEQIRNGIMKLISLRDAERAIDKLRKTMLAKVGEGSEAWVKYVSSTSKLEAVVRKYQSDTEAIEVSQRALAHGPVDAPWERGTFMALRAAALSLPWCAAYAAFFARDSVPSHPQWWLDLIAIFILGLAQWPLFGFFFGYFYPDIRGGNGLVKALVYFVTIAAPPVLSHVIFNAELPRMIFSLWIFQNFILSMVLGLFAGDYRTLRRYGLGWRHLRDVHHLGVLTAYGTSVIIAIGGAISTAIAGGLVDALKALAK